MTKEIWLSKSKIGTYLMCPYRYKLIYVDGIEEPKSKAMIRGGDIHKEIEKFYKEGVEWSGKDYIFKYVPSKLKKFIEFERRRAEKCKKYSDPEKMFRPLLVEYEIKNKAFKLSGIVDAVFRVNDDYCIIDWKTGRFRKNDISNIRRELAIYKILLDNSNVLDKPVKYWGMYFIDEDVLFFEKCKSISVRKAFETIEKVRKKIENCEFNCNVGIHCRWCGFVDSCPMK